MEKLKLRTYNSRMGLLILHWFKFAWNHFKPPQHSPMYTGKYMVFLYLFNFFGGEGDGLGLLGCIVFSKFLTLPLGPAKEKHDPSQKTT